jgi:type IV secretory pathway VirB6-like protein
MIPLIGYRYFMNALRRYSKFVFIFPILFFLLTPLAAFAVDAQFAPDCGPVKNTVGNIFSCTPKEGITYRFTECVTDILQNVAGSGFDKVLAGTAKIVGSVLTISVALAGIKMVLGGMRNMKAEVMTTLLKLAFVAAFCFGTGVAGGSALQKTYKLVMDMNVALVNTVSGALISSGPCSTSATGAPENNIWKRVDCTIFAFVGKVQPTYETVDFDFNGNGTLEPTEIGAKRASLVFAPKDVNCDGNMQNRVTDDFTLFEFGLSQLFTPHGIFIIFLLGAAALMLLIAFAKALQIYVISFVAITFLMLLAPFFIPLFLFMRTRQMFITWISMILGYMIQPAMLMAFVVFLLASMNVALHGTTDASGNVTSAGLVHSLDLMNKAMNGDPNSPDPAKRVGNQCTRKVLGCSFNGILGAKDSVAPEENFLDCLKRRRDEEVNAITAPVTEVPYDQLSVFMVHLISCIVLLYVMMALMNNVADFVASLSAGAGSNLGGFGRGMAQLTGAAKDAASSIAK